MEFEQLIGKHALARDRPEDYIAWAEQQMVGGVDSASLPILASMDFERPLDSEEVRRCFLRVAAELGLDWPDEISCLRRYAGFVSRQIIGRDIEPVSGVRELEALYAASEYREPLFAIWLYLDEDIDLLDSEYGAIFNAGLTGENLDDYIRKVAIQYLKLTELEIPQRFDRFAHCRDCGHFDEPAQTEVPLRWLPAAIRRRLLPSWSGVDNVCRACGSTHLEWMTGHDGRQAYLAKHAQST